MTSSDHHCREVGLGFGGDPFDRIVDLQPAEYWGDAPELAEQLRAGSASSSLVSSGLLPSLILAWAMQACMGWISAVR